MQNWRNEENDMADRLAMASKIVLVIQKNGLDLQLRDVIELNLYKKAASKEIYLDNSTLEARIQEEITTWSKIEFVRRLHLVYHITTCNKPVGTCHENCELAKGLYYHAQTCKSQWCTTPGCSAMRRTKQLYEARKERVCLTKEQIEMVGTYAQQRIELENVLEKVATKRAEYLKLTQVPNIHDPNHARMNDLIIKLELDMKRKEYEDAKMERQQKTEMVKQEAQLLRKALNYNNDAVLICECIAHDKVFAITGK